jgi:hypothetical protein
MTVLGASMFAGHVAAPVQVSAGSHTPTDARHSVPTATRASAGHWFELPVHLSSMSQLPAAARHTTDGAANASAGHVAVPVHVSATSQMLTAGRQVVPTAASTSAGQTVDDPLHTSAGSQVPAEARH